MSATPAATEAEYLQVLQLLQDSHSTCYTAIAGLTVLVLDHIMTIPEEVEYMWRCKWSLAKCLYLWNRYFGLAALSFATFYTIRPTVSDNACQVFLQLEGVATAIIIGTADVVLLLRVYVLYGNSKRMLLFLIPLVSCEVIPMIIISIFSDLSLKHFIRLDNLFGCYALRKVYFHPEYKLITSSP